MSTNMSSIGVAVEETLEEAFREGLHSPFSRGNALREGTDDLGGKTATVRKLLTALEQEVDALAGLPVVNTRSQINFNDEVRRFEINLIEQALRETGGNQRRASRLLGIKASTLHAKIRLYGIETGRD
jgi:DNA-binding NtrC family response regulator